MWLHRQLWGTAKTGSEAISGAQAMALADESVAYAPNGEQMLRF